MATLGLTRLRAINRVLRGSGYDQITTAPVTADTDEAADAEDILDEVTDTVLTKGFPENTQKGKEYTPDGNGPQAGSGTSVADDNAGWAASTKTITAAGDFSGYTFGAGDTIYIYPVANTTLATLVEGYHPIASKANNDSITLDSQPSDANDTFGIRAVGNLVVTVGTDILKVRSSYGSPNGHRSLVLNNDQTLYDADRGTSTLATDDTIYLDVTVDYTFEKLSAPLKEHIVAIARVDFQRWKKKLVDRDNMLLMEAAWSEIDTLRNPMEQGQQVQPHNVGSSLLQTLRQTDLNQPSDRR
jgi:hypothetical protein